MTRRSIGFALTIGIALALLVLTLAVGWQILVASDLDPVARGLTGLHWLLRGLGALFFGLVVVGLALLCAWLIREMRLNQRQQAFLDAVTHEMRTPLASLRLYVDTLARHDPQPERRSEFLRRMRDDIERLDRTVGQVLAAARAEDLRAPAARERVELADLLARSIAEICARHRLPAHAFRLDAAPPVTVVGDPAELELVFRNLLENAVKYSGDPVDVRVRAGWRPDGRVEIEIADRGIGIPPRELRKIFQRFYRAGRDVRTAAGLGLGLFIVRGLVRRNGGRVVARSEGTGRGSRFVVTLRPARTPALLPARARPFETYAEDPGR